MFQRLRHGRSAHPADGSPAVRELRDLVQQATDADGVISPHSVQDILTFVEERGIDLHAAPGVARDINIGLARGGTFFRVQSAALLARDETPIYVTDADLLREVKDREYRGGSRGFSVPLGGGIRYRVGATRGQLVTVGSHWEVGDSGRLTVTDRRAIFTGSRKNLEFLFSKLTALDLYSDAISLGVSNRQTVSVFKVPDSEQTSVVIHAASERRDSTITVLRTEAS